MGVEVYFELLLNCYCKFLNDRDRIISVNLVIFVDSGV